LLQNHKLMPKTKGGFSSWHVGVSAEAFAAAFFAWLGYDISVQYGANQPEYDLIISKGKNYVPIKVSVKGSQDGSWGLTQGYLQKGKADYHESISKWLQTHGTRTILCLVQFKDVELTKMPRIYIATPQEIAQQLRQSAKGRGETQLYEYKKWNKRAFGYGTIDQINESWRFSQKRLEEIEEIFNL
jgi:hypothetical protein